MGHLIGGLIALLVWLLMIPIVILAVLLALTLAGVGVAVGLLAAAMGIDRENWTNLEPLTRFSMGVRHDRPGIPKMDYQTTGCASGDKIIKADGTHSKDGVVSQRFYLADASFLVGLECDERSLLERAHAIARRLGSEGT